MAEKLASKNPLIKVVNHTKNKGYGAALKTGFKAAKYDWVFFTDGDLQFKLSQLKKLVPHTSTHNVIIGYRQKRAEGAFRAFNARLFKLYIDILFRLNVRDIDCAFKLMKTDVIKSIHLDSGGAFTSAELLYKLKKQGHTFKQIGVTHLKRRFGKPTGSNLKVIIRAGFEALKLYLTIKLKSLQSVFASGLS